MNILIIDNYDSFTYNLFQGVGELLEERRKGRVQVFRNDAITLSQATRFDKIILSPGPGNPGDKKYFGVCADILQQITTIPILGVCLGMQGIAHYFGGKVIPAKEMMHGKTSTIAHDNKGIFSGVAQGISVMRYHSLVVEAESLPSSLEISSTVFSSNAGVGIKPSHSEIMGIRHKHLPIEGVQFHPESFATEEGEKMLSNFLFRRYV